MALTLNGTTGISGIAGSAGTPALQGNNDANTGYFFAADTLGLSTAGTERLRVDSNGNLSIHSAAYSGGGAAPQLYVVGTGGRQVKIHNPNAGTCSLQLSNATTGQGEDAGFQLAQLSGGDFYFDHQLQAKDIVFRTKPSGGSVTEGLRIDSSGNVGINDSTPTFKLDVNGTGRFADNLTINTTKKIQSNSSQGQLTIQGGATYPGSAIKFAGGQSGTTDRGEMIFYAGEATSLEERFRIDSSGTVTVQSEDVVFGTTNKGIEFPNSASVKQNLSNLYVNLASGNNNVEVQSNGTSFVKFRGTNGNVELVNGNLVISTAGKGIDFSATSDGPSQGNETLDDYERGTYTPQGLSWNGSAWVNVTFDSISRYGRYTKIGGYVHVQGYFSNFHVDSSFDNTLAGIDLPFAPINAGGHYSVGVTTHSTAFSAAGYTTFFVNSSGSSHMYSMQENTTSYNTWSGSSGRYLMFQASYMCE